VDGSAGILGGMDKSIRALYTPTILAEAQKRYGLSPEPITKLDGFESFIYMGQREGSEYVLRILHSLQRSPEQVQGELEWIEHLAANGVAVGRGVRSPAGNWVETILAQEGRFIACLFEKAPGRFVKKEEFNAGLFEKMGRLVGRMNALAKTFEPSAKRCRRPDWYAELAGFARKNLPPSEKITVEKYDAMIEEMKQLPVDRESFGMVHQDVHTGNFHIYDGRLTLFDFGDCQYAWFIYDIAMALFYAVPIAHADEAVRTRAAMEFLEPFLRGYFAENNLDKKWGKTIPLFLKLREIDLYAAIHRSLDLDHLDPWCVRFMNGRKQRIEQDVPFLELDLSQVAWE
jgi:Ser/Thr protein kinase RdoA (MazF antagonist)